jgi:hypothetical protein
MDIPEAREKILKSIGIDVMPQQQQNIPQDPSMIPSEPVAELPNQPIGR